MATLPDNSSLSRQAVLGTIFAALAAVGFSAKAILVKLAYASPVDAVTLLAIRMAFSVPFFSKFCGFSQVSKPILMAGHSLSMIENQAVSRLRPFIM